jgi:hypothetical protein
MAVVSKLVHIQKRNSCVHEKKQHTQQEAKHKKQGNKYETKNKNIKPVIGT